MEEEKKNFKGWIEKNTILAFVCTLILGILLGCLVMYLTNFGEKVASVKGKTITSKDLYSKMKSYISINLLLEDVDRAILNKKYNLEADEIEEVKKTAQEYIDMYKSYYGYTDEQFLSENGFDSFDDFVEYLSTDYKRTVYYFETLEKQLEENSVQKYYDENSFGKVNTKHILVKTSEGMSEEEALKIANEIISRLDNGEDFDILANEYVEKYKDTIITENLGEKGAFDHLDEGYVDGMKALSKGEYSKTPIQTLYGYHVIYCVDKTEKTEKISRKDRMEIVEELAKDIMEADVNIYNKTLIKMREEAKLKFYDKDLEEKYVEYCAQYNEDEGKIESQDINIGDTNE